jgi:hypothetical protein
LVQNFELEKAKYTKSEIPPGSHLNTLMFTLIPSYAELHGEVIHLWSHAKSDLWTTVISFRDYDDLSKHDPVHV